MSSPFIAEIRIMPYTFAPRAWAWCEGQTLPISANTAMFALLGTYFGGDGRTTFGLPNMTSRSPMGARTGPGLTPRVLAEESGQDTVTLDLSETPSHTHTVFGEKGNGTEPTGTGNFLAGSRSTAAQNRAYSESAPDSVMHDFTIGKSGGGQAHANRQPMLAVNFCIATLGIFPSRN